MSDRAKPPERGWVFFRTFFVAPFFLTLTLTFGQGCALAVIEASAPVPELAGEESSVSFSFAQYACALSVSGTGPAFRPFTVQPFPSPVRREMLVKTALLTLSLKPVNPPATAWLPAGHVAVAVPRP